MTNHSAYLSLGTNLGCREENIRRAVEMLEERAGRVELLSSLIETEPWGFDSENRFLNACLLLRTALSPRELLAATQEIERQMGRKEKSTDGEYHDRLIDIDILTYDDISVDEPDLKIPHPLMTERDFVMTPLKEIKKQ